MNPPGEPVEAKAIATLFGDLDDEPVGYVYQWDTGELSLMITCELSVVVGICPALESGVLELAGPTTPEELVSYLMELSKVAS